MKKKLFISILLLSGILSSCGGSTSPNDTSGVNSSVNSNETKKYEVTFANTSLAKQSIEEGKNLSKPQDPIKDGSIFAGWYKDSSFTTEVSFPLTVNADTTLYAKYYTYKEAFQKARQKTIGTNVEGYEYDYEMQATATIASKSVTGNTVGVTKYSKDGEVSYQDKHVNSGLLFKDGTVYQERTGTNLAKVTLDADDKVEKYKLEQVEEGFTFDSSNFAKAIFEFSDEDIKGIEKTDVANVYKLKTSFKASNAISIIGNHLNNALVEKYIGEMPETSVDTSMLVTFENGELKSYKYNMSISVSKFTFDLTYTSTFKNIGVKPIIVPLNYGEAIITPSAITSAKKEVTDALDAYKAKAHSSYKFDVKTDIDPGITTNAIGAHFQGTTKRKVTDNKVYAWNEVEIDSDLKNADLYKEKGIADVKYKRTRLTTDKIVQFKKGLVNYDDGSEVAERSNDDYYLLDLVDNMGSPSFVQKITAADTNTTTYVLGVNETNVASLMTWLNDNLDLNPYETATANPHVFGEFNANTLDAKKSKLIVALTNGELKSINLTSSGRVKTSFKDSRDFTEEKKASYDFSYTLTTTSDGDSFEPADTIANAKKL
jgi:uncharacterized repeat protein (TIGR02543 family)